MSFSYDPPERSLGDLMCAAIDDAEQQAGSDPALEAAEYLHSKLLLHGERHHVDVDGPREVVLRMPPVTALWLAQLVEEAWRNKPAGRR